MAHIIINGVEALLKTDAVPEGPRPCYEERDLPKNDLDSEQQFYPRKSTPEPIIEEAKEEDEVHAPPTKPRRKHKTRKNVDEQIPYEKYERDNTPPVNIHAAGNVINISGSNGVHIGTKNEIIINTNGYSSKSGFSRNASCDRKMTKNDKAVLSCTEPCDGFYIEEVSLHLGKEWRDVFRALEYSDGMLDQFWRNYYDDGNLKEVIFQLLLDWTRNDPSGATVGRLATVLWDKKLKDVVQCMKCIWKASKEHT